MSTNLNNGETAYLASYMIDGRRVDVDAFMCREDFLRFQAVDPENIIDTVVPICDIRYVKSDKIDTGYQSYEKPGEHEVVLKLKDLPGVKAASHSRKLCYNKYGVYPKLKYYLGTVSFSCHENTVDSILNLNNISITTLSPKKMDDILYNELDKLLYICGNHPERIDSKLSNFFDLMFELRQVLFTEITILELLQMKNATGYYSSKTWNDLNSKIKEAVKSGEQRRPMTRFYSL